MPNIDANGTRFEYHEDGSGAPVVLVHGSANDYRTWQPQREAIARQFRVFAYSRRYHWPNDPIPEGIDYSMRQQVDDLQALLPALGAGPCHLVGHSYGAFLSLLVALRDPTLVRSLVLAEPPVMTLHVSMPPRPPELLKLLLTRPRLAVAIVRFGATCIGPAQAAFRRGDALTGARTFADAVLGSGGFDQLPQEMRTMVEDNLTNLGAELLGSGFLPLSEGPVRALRTPTLLITGQRTPPLFRMLANHLAGLLQHAEQVDIPGASHAMHMDNPGAFNAALLGFMSRHSQRA
jgi:pimeloyl-ACP methyl ester carboxylesterase